ncbi:hypothetical protein [Thalassovita taeanensis]|uniref:Uncharacterized protein n=1 Tax=Thalassovita taeanensis TaxID=657014 RepID=A0A1H9FC30_9RHOB|nr:hypothetical protein [Thalassovita taeanensis]SEQ34983.1 hypothetical protein SAMN04488092_10613 [Thalassovita taeanensis]
MALDDQTTQPSVHNEATAANVEVVTATLKELRKGLQMIAVDPEAGAKIVNGQADLLSKAIASLSTQIAHLRVPEKRDDDRPPAPVIDIDEAVEAAETLMSILDDEVCQTCGCFK